MTTSRFRRIDRRRLVASSAIGGAAILTGGWLARSATGPDQPLAAPAALARQDDSGDVPMFRGNAARTGAMPGPGPDDSNGVEVIWTFTTGDWGLLSSPAVVDGVIYVGGEAFNLYAVNPENGIELWRFATGEPVVSSPVVVDGMVYVGSRDGNLYAVNAENGAEVWRFATGDGVSSSPAVVDGLVYVGSGDGNLYAVNAADGTERWRFATSGSISSSPAVDDGVVYVGNRDGDVYAVDAEGGTEVWRFATGDQSGDWNSPSPAVVDRVVYAGSLDSTISAVDAEEGTERWRFTTSGGFYSSPAVVDGVLYVGSWDGTLYAVDVEDGTERWRFAAGPYMYSSPAVVDGVVYVGSGDGNLYAIGARVPRLGVGGSARVMERISLRGGPAPTAVERAELAPGTVVTITGEAETTGGVEWWPVVVDETGDQGWVEASALEPLSSGPDSTPTA